MRLRLISPRGFCAGVDMAVTALERALEKYGTPLFAYHQIVHNTHVVRQFEERGVRFVDDVAQVPHGGTVVFSAHGVSPVVREMATRRKLLVVDATCPLVGKVHREAERFARDGFSVLLVGHHGHDETVGIAGEAPEHVTLVQNADEARRVQVPDPSRVAYLTQTTLSVTDTAAIISILADRFPQIVGPNSSDICYATENRQQAVRKHAVGADVILVIGSANSSNTMRLVEEGLRAGTPSHRIDGPADLDPSWVQNGASVVLTAGASVPESLVSQTVDFLERKYGAIVEEKPGVLEDVTFRLPLPVRPRQPAVQLRTRASRAV